MMLLLYLMRMCCGECRQAVALQAAGFACPAVRCCACGAALGVTDRLAHGCGAPRLLSVHVQHACASLNGLLNFALFSAEDGPSALLYPWYPGCDFSMYYLFLHIRFKGSDAPSAIRWRIGLPWHQSARASYLHQILQKRDLSTTAFTGALPLGAPYSSLLAGRICKWLLVPNSP